MRPFYVFVAMATVVALVGCSSEHHDLPGATRSGLMDELVRTHSSTLEDAAATCADFEAKAGQHRFSEAIALGQKLFKKSSWNGYIGFEFYYPITEISLGRLTELIGTPDAEVHIRAAEIFPWSTYEIHYNLGEKSQAIFFVTHKTRIVRELVVKTG